MLKVLHTGDWHIGSFPGPEVGGQNARFQDICCCLDFQAMYAEEHRPDLIVVSGDIFHQARVWSDRGLRESRTAIDHIRRLSNVAPTVVLRGTPNHDSEEQFEMENAFNNLKISVGDVLNPALTQVYEGFTGVFAGMSDFVDEYPAVVAAISAIAVGVGGFTGALAAYNLATTAAKFVTEAFTATLAANPYVLAAAGIVAVTAAAVTLTGVLITQSDEYEGMTATCRDQYDELQRLNDQYNAACEQYGENSDAANSLRYQLDQLNDEFETNRQTVKEFVAECDGLVESHNKVMDAYNSSTSSIKDQGLGTLALTQRLGELASQNTQTTASYTEMKAIIDQLNADVPGLGLTYDGVTESVDATVEAIKKAAKAQADSEYKAEQQQTYVDLLKEQSSLEQQIAEAEANLDAERQRRGMRQDDVTGDWVSGSGFWMEDSPWVAWTSDIDDYKKSLEELQAAYDENQQTLSDIEGEWRGVAQAVEDSQNQTVSYEEAVSAAVSAAQTELDNLTAAYDKAYESARTSIEGQIGLFDTMKTSSELSISDMEKAMQSQTDYLNLYSENLKKAAEYGLDDGLIKSLSDGSEESAGYINAIIQNIEKLGGSTEGMPAAASKFVTEFNSKFEETEKAKDTFADNVAKMETDFDEKMGEIETRMSKTVQNMEMTDEARKAAQDTIKAYCDAIRSMTGEAGSAAEAVANAAASHLKTEPTTTPTTTTPTATTVTGHANGTLSAQEDVYIAGEEGPELIIGARGSEVFPTQETERILAAVNSVENATNAPDDTAPEAAILPAEAAVEPVEANYPVEQEVPQESPVAAPADNRAEEPVPAPADAFPVQEAEVNPAPEEPATTAPEQEPETTAAPAEPAESPEEPTATVEVPTTTPEPELPTDVPATPFAAAALPEPTASPLPENDLPEGMEAVKEYSYLTADGQGSDAQPTGIEYVEPEVQAQTTEEAAPAEEAPVNTTAPAASDAQQEAPASSSDAPSIGETVKRIILEINGSGSIDVGGMNEEFVLDILTRHAKPVLMNIIKGEIFEEGDLAYDF